MLFTRPPAASRILTLREHDAERLSDTGMRIVVVWPSGGAKGFGVAVIPPTTGAVVSKVIVSWKLLETLPARSR
jgi:hypothetical protein